VHDYRLQHKFVEKTQTLITILSRDKFENLCLQMTHESAIPGQITINIYSQHKFKNNSISENRIEKILLQIKL